MIILKMRSPSGGRNIHALPPLGMVVMFQLKKRFSNEDVRQGISSMRWLWRHSEGYRFPLSILLVLDVTVSFLQVWVAFLSRDLIDSAFAGGMRRLAVTTAFFIAVALLVVLLGSLRSSYTNTLLEQYANGLREDLFERVIRADWLKISRYDPDDLLSRLTDDVKEVGNGLLSYIPGVLALLIQVVVSFTALAIFEPGLALAALIMMPVISLSSRFFKKRTGHVRNVLRALENRFLSLMRETLGNLPTVKALRLEKVSHGKLHAIHQSRMEWVNKSMKMGMAAEMILSVRAWGVFLLAFLWCAVRLAAGMMTFGSILAYMQLVGQVQRPFASFEGMMPGIIGTFAAVNRVMVLDALAEEDKTFTPAKMTNTKEEQTVTWFSAAWLLNGPATAAWLLNRPATAAWLLNRPTTAAWVLNGPTKTSWPPLLSSRYRADMVTARVHPNPQMQDTF